MTMLGRIKEFDECSSNSFEEYIERLECFFHANDIEDDAKKRSVLLSVCGAKTYSTLRSVLAPTQPSTLSYANIVSALKRSSVQHRQRSFSVFSFTIVSRKVIKAYLTTLLNFDVSLCTVLLEIS